MLIRESADANIKDSDGKLAVELAAIRGHFLSLEALAPVSTEKSWGHVLEAACEAGQLIVVHYVLSQRLASPDGDETQDSRPLSRAVSSGHHETVRALLRYGAAADLEDRGTQRTPLHHAAMNGSYDITLTLLDYGAKANAPDGKRETPLHAAASKGCVNIIKLLEHKANVDTISETRTTALHLAVRSPESVTALLAAHAKPSACDFLRQTPLHIAAKEKCHLAIPILLTGGADIDAKEDDGRSALFYGIEENDLPTVDALCRGQNELRYSEGRMRQVLEGAVSSYRKYQSITILRFLLEFSSKGINTKGPKDESVLHIAAEEASPEVLRLLLEYGANINLLSQYERTPLHCATISGRVDNMKELVKSGADVDMGDHDGETALQYAAKGGDLDAIKILFDAGADVNKQNVSTKFTALYQAAYSGETAVVKVLLEWSADVSLAIVGGWSPLHAAADNLAIAMMLLEKGADSNLQKADLWTPLHLAAYWSKADVIEKLIVVGHADHNKPNSDGMSALHLAARECDLRVVISLWHHGANLNLLDKQGMTPLHLAISSSAEIVKFMLDNGGDYKLKTGDGHSCLSLLNSEHDDPDRIKVLEMLLGLEDPEVLRSVWDFADMVHLYWQAIKETGSVKVLKILVRKEPRLLDEISREGYTGLETCLRNKWDDDGAAMAACLVEIGVGPFKRPRPGAESCFELGIVARRRPRLSFLDASIQIISDMRQPESPDLDLGFKELPIITELNKPEIWEILKPLIPVVSSATDQDGWNLEHFIHQAGDRVPLNPNQSLLSSLTETPKAMVMPLMWQPLTTEEKAPFHITRDGCEVEFACEYCKTLVSKLLQDPCLV